MVVKEEKYLLISAPSPSRLIKELNLYAYEGYKLVKISDDWCEAIIEKENNNNEMRT